MGFEQIIAAFGPSALPAVAILFAVKMMLNFQAIQLKLDRDQHEKEIDKLIQAHSETSAGIIEGLSNLRDETLAEINVLKRTPSNITNLEQG